jgi:propanediol dehydratase large subunit
LGEAIEEGSVDPRTSDGGWRAMTEKYEICIRGRLSRTLATEFEQLDLTVTTEPVETVLHGPVTDQAALYGLLRRIEAFGLELVEVRRTPSEV